MSSLMDQARPEPSGDTRRSFSVTSGYGFVGLILIGILVVWLLYQGGRALFGGQ